MDINDYQCPDCGAVHTFEVTGMCDECILKFYFEDVNAPRFEWEN